MYSIYVPFCNLDQIYNSLIIPRWIKLRDGKYVIPLEDKVTKVEQFDNNRLLFSCQSEDFYNIWFYYFDMEYDYGEPNHVIKRQDQFSKICANRAGGIRLLNQDSFEIIIKSIILDYYKDKDKTRNLIDKISESIGKKHKNFLGELNPIIWYSFPRAIDLLKNIDKVKVKSDLKERIKEASYYYSYKWIDLDFAKGISEYRGQEYLQSFDCINEVSSGYILLMANHNLKCYPDDENFINIIYDKSEDIDSWFSKIKNFYGIAYLYVMYESSNPPKEIKYGTYR